MRLFRLITALCAFVALSLGPGSAADPAPEYSRVHALFQQHCLDCHAVQDPEGKLILETYDLLMKGGESGRALIPGKADESLLVRMVEGKFEKNGKTIVMPPGKRAKLSQEEVHLLRSWINSGAPAPAVSIVQELVIPRITPAVPPKSAIHSFAWDEKSKMLAVARHGPIELWSVEEQRLVRTLEDSIGIWNAVVFSRDGAFLFVAGGESGISGELRQYNVATGKQLRAYKGHTDSLYSLALSPDGKTLASGGYDQKIKLWSTDSGAELKTLTGHNGCVYALDFRSDGKILASASGDRTVKLWDVLSGERRDTLSQSLKELYTVAFSPDGKRVAAGGVDNRIRVWEVSPDAKETTNPILYATFAHEGAILRLAFSSDGKSLASSAEDRTVKIWEAAEIKEKLLLEAQPDWAPALAFALQAKALVVGRLDGSLAFYEANNGSHLALPKPELARIHPRAVQSGVETTVKVTGKFLASVKNIKTSHAQLQALILDQRRSPTELWLKISASADLPRGEYDVRLAADSGDTAPFKLHVDHLPIVSESPDNAKLSLPASIWGDLQQSGETDRFEFEAKAGQVLVFDAAAKSIGSKADLVLTLSDSHGKVLASNNGFEQSPDPFLTYRVEADGTYRLTVAELVLGASPEHFYRVAVGELPFVLATFPSVVPAGISADVQLLGFNLPASAVVKVPPAKPGEAIVLLDETKYRSRKPIKVAVSERPPVLESESNNDFKSAPPISPPAIIAARIEQPGDEDWFRFHAKKGETWLLETAAARRGFPTDTKIEVMDAEGKPVTRLLLQAVRDSAVTFRGIDSNTVDCRVENWEEMELNQYLYLQGEVVRLFRMPQGPDSGFNFYAINGKRRNYFDTSATAHANEEPCYIVHPHPPGARLVPNGLPVFPIYFVNDDDADRKLGTDSKLYFSGPADGIYHVRVTDTRSFGGDRFLYELTIRPAQPDFTVTLNGTNPTIAPGSGQSFSVVADRIDGFEGEIEIDISNLPAGFTASHPLVIQAGHTSALGTINAALDAVKPEAGHVGKIKARATINGQTITKEVNGFGRLNLAEKATVYVTLEPDAKAAEITIAPGQTVPAWLKVRRNGHDDLLTFSVDNLPHGIIVDNIGLNGVLIPKGENERAIFFSAAKWVPETDRLCYAICNEAGRQTSLPVLLKVRKERTQQVARN